MFFFSQFLDFISIYLKIQKTGLPGMAHGSTWPTMAQHDMMHVKWDFMGRHDTSFFIYLMCILRAKQGLHLDVQ